MKTSLLQRVKAHQPQFSAKRFCACIEFHRDANESLLKALGESRQSGIESKSEKRQGSKVGHIELYAMSEIFLEAPH